MSRFRPFSPRSGGPEAGFSSIESLVAVSIMVMGISMGTSLLLAGKSHIVEQGKELEVTQGARAALDTMLREIRLGGACLPVTGQFIALDGADDGSNDQLTVRVGATRPDLSCIRAASTTVAAAGATRIAVDDVAGFAPGMLIYLRHPNGTGEYHSVAGIDSGDDEIELATPLADAQPPTTGIYALEERRFLLGTRAVSGITVPELLLQVNGATPQSFAVGIEQLDVKYQMVDDAITDLPAGNGEWMAVDRVTISVTARSLLPDRGGGYYRRTMTMTAKPRNLIDS